MLFDELDGHVAVRLDVGFGQFLFPPEGMVIVQNSVMGQGKPGAGHVPGKGVVVPVVFSLPLSGHSAVARNDVGVLRNKEVQLVGRARALVDMEAAAGIVGDARSVGAPAFTLNRQGAYHLPLLPAAQAVAVVNESKQTAHQSSTPTSTGSFT